MMKKIYLTAAFLILVTCIALGQSKKDIQKYAIKSIEETRFKADSAGNLQPGKRFYTEYTKDAEVLRFEEYKGNGKLYYQEINEYGKEGRISQIENYPEGEKKGDNAYYKKTVEKYRDGLKVEQFEYDSTGTLIEHTFYTYDKWGERTGNKKYTPAGELREEEVFKYNDKGLLIEHLIKDASGAVVERIVYKYAF